MAFTANTMFEARVTNAVFDETLNVTGKYQYSAADADCSAGHLCVRSSTRLSNQGYTGLHNDNAYIFNDAASTDYDGIYACNPFQVEAGVSNRGNVYKIGAETLGLGIPAGEFDTFTKIKFDNASIYRFGVGNMSTTVSTNTIFTISGGQLVPAASAPAKAGKPYFKLVGTGTATEGAYASMTYYDVMACRDVVVEA